MALWNTESSNGTYINLKLTRNADDKPVFVRQEDFKDTNEHYTEVKGKLKSITGSFTPKSATNKYDTHGAKIQLTDGDEIYCIDTTITNGSKDMLNGLLSVAIWEEVTLVVYTNKAGYAAGAAIKDNSLEGKDKFFPNFIPWSDEYKTGFKGMIFNELDSRKAPEEVAKEEVSMEDIPF